MIADSSTPRKLPLPRALALGAALVGLQSFLHGFFSPIYFDLVLGFFCIMLVRARLSHLLVLALFLGLLQESLSPVPAGFYLCRNLMIVPVVLSRQLFVWRRTITWVWLFAYAFCCELLLFTAMRLEKGGYFVWDFHTQANFIGQDPIAEHAKHSLTLTIAFAAVSWFFYSQRATFYRWVYKYKRTSQDILFAKEVG